jgi:hypothetical protein
VKTAVCGVVKPNQQMTGMIIDRIRPVKARLQAFSVSQFHGMSSSMRFIL